MDTHPPLGTGAASGPDLPPRRLRILIADDNRDTVLTLTMLLQDEGHEVHGVYTGTDVVKYAHLSRFDAMILDIEMPGISGYATAQELRTHSYPERGPLLIAISGKWNRPSEKLLAQLAGFDHHLEKPCDPQALLRLLKPLTLSGADKSDPAPPSVFVLK